MLSGNYKLKQWDPLYTIRMTRVQNTDNTKMPMRMGSNRNSHSLLPGKQNGMATLKDSVLVNVGCYNKV